MQRLTSNRAATTGLGVSSPLKQDKKQTKVSPDTKPNQRSAAVSSQTIKRKNTPAKVDQKTDPQKKAIEGKKEKVAAQEQLAISNKNQNASQKNISEKQLSKGSQVQQISIFSPRHQDEKQGPSD